MENGNPETYLVVAAAFEEAMKIINADKRAAAEVYCAEKSRFTADEVHKMPLDETRSIFAGADKSWCGRIT